MVRKKWYKVILIVLIVLGEVGSPISVAIAAQINGEIAQATLKSTIFGPETSFQAENASNELIMSNFGACEANL